MEFSINEQLKSKPEILNPKPLNFDNVIVGGMGGSGLPARAMFYLDPVYPLWLHNDYGLPKKFEGKTLFVAVSYSGNTKETLSFAREAHERALPLAIITSGGTLKEFVERENLTHVLVPEGLQPRDALVYMLKALLLILGKQDILEDIGKMGEFEAEAEGLAGFISGGEALIYSSHEDSALGYIWKVYLNESAKIPAFCNFFPELLHNELESIDAEKRIILISETKQFLEMAEKKGWKVRPLTSGGDKSEKLIRNLVLARSVAYKIAEKRGVDPDKVPTIEEFKRRLNG